MSKKIILLLFAAFLSTFFCWNNVNAQESPRIDYGGQPIIDSDLDGLTDQGEIQIFNTNPIKADTDGDGFSDGTEVLAGTDPLDAASYPGVVKAPVADAAPIQQAKPAENPAAWYASRASGLVAFLLLYISIFLGLTLRIPLLRKIFSPVYSMKIHCWISFQALLFAFFHAVVLIFDKWLGFRLSALFIPFASQYKPELTALGVFGFYLMIILIITSYSRKLMSQKIWRAVHFTNIVLYGIVFVHALYLGTDLKVELFRNIFIWANAFLVLLMLVNMELRLGDARRIRKQRQEALNSSIIT
ncbi:MAG: ferric reductase-like transmembrane domain-containing protein [Candidatus Moraniibacteriota bacterium]